MNINAQEYLEKNSDPKQETVISRGSLRLIGDTKLIGDLVIQDYPQLAEIDLPNHELTSLSIINCPNLKQINLRQNQLTKLELESPELIELFAGKNELTTLNLSNCQKIKKLIVPDNPYLTKLENLNLTTIQNINLANTLVDLGKDYEKLKARKEEALAKIKTLKEAAEEKELILAEPIQTPEQVEEAILRHLKKTGEKWLSHLQNGDNPILATRLNSPQRKKHFRDILREISETQTHKNYQQLVKRWSRINDYQELVQKWKDDEDYGLDFDGSLDRLLTLMQKL